MRYILFYSPDAKDDETEAKGDYVICPRSCS